MQELPLCDVYLKSIGGTQLSIPTEIDVRLRQIWFMGLVETMCSRSQLKLNSHNFSAV